MTDLALSSSSLPMMLHEAAQRLENATTAAEVLEARDMAGVAYDVAKHAGRIAMAKRAHDDVIATAHRAQADALEIEAAAKRRLANEYDAAQGRGEVAGDGRPKTVVDDNGIPTAADLGLRRDEIYEARQLRDAEEAEPGIVHRVLGEMLDRADEPTKAALRREVIGVVMRHGGGEGLRVDRRNPDYQPDPQYAAMAAVMGACRRIIELVEEHGADGIIAGFIIRGMRERNLETMGRARDALALIEEACNEQHPA
jgi:hypothetical protein